MDKPEAVPHISLYNILPFADRNTQICVSLLFLPGNATEARMLISSVPAIMYNEYVVL